MNSMEMVRLGSFPRGNLNREYSVQKCTRDILPMSDYHRYVMSLSAPVIFKKIYSIYSK